TAHLATMLLIPLFLLLLLLVHGIPVLLYRNDLARPAQVAFGLSTSVASLGIVVVITRIGVHAQSMNPDIAQALVASALLSILVYPTAAGIVAAKTAAPRPSG